MSCGQLALQRAGIEYENYFASEIKPFAIQCTQHNFPNTIQLGDVREINTSKLPKIDLLIGGSPCQDLSNMNKKRDGLQGEKSNLFFDYLRILKETKPKYFLLENVQMDERNYQLISSLLKTYPVNINSQLVSAQLRNRFYWTNIGKGFKNLMGEWVCQIQQPHDRNILFSDIIESGRVESKKAFCLTARYGFAYGDLGNIEKLKLKNTQRYLKTRYERSMANFVFEKDYVRALTVREMERLQTVPEGYCECLNNWCQAANLLGDGWTVDVIAHIFSFMDL